MQSSPYGKKSRIDQAEESTVRNLLATSGFMTALNTEVGQILFKDLIILLDEKFKLIYEETSTERDRAIFSACKYIGNRWNDIIEQHGNSTKNMEEIQRVKNRKKLE